MHLNHFSMALSYAGSALIYHLAIYACVCIHDPSKLAVSSFGRIAYEWSEGNYPCLFIYECMFGREMGLGIKVNYFIDTYMIKNR